MEGQNDSSESLNLKALVIGATGATGRELTDILLVSQHFKEVYVLARRKIDRWENLKDAEKNKLKIIMCEDLSILSKEKDEIEKSIILPNHINSLFCCLGSRTGKGKDEFTKVDYEYVVNSASLCEKFNIPHFSLISTKGANSNSFLMYFKVKGQADDDCKTKNIPYISIFRPGVILDRDNDSRFGEKVLKFVPFIDKIKSHDLAMKMYIDSINYFKHKSLNLNKILKTIYSHSDILKIN
jgi:oxidoreductase